MKSTPTPVVTTILVQAIAVIVFIVAPITITLMVPFTDIEFRKTGGSVSVGVRRYVLVFIPWETKEILNVKALRAEITSEKKYQDTSENRRKGNTGTRLATGQLVIVNDGSEVAVQAAPELATEISKQFDQFLTSASNEPVKFSVYASWGLSYVLGGIASFFAAFYLFGALVSVVIYPFKRLRVLVK